jgi:hypothetical protein
MLKWAIRIVAVGGALLAIAVGTAAWMHRKEGREWMIATPIACSYIIISKQDVFFEVWLRREHDINEDGWDVERYAVDGSAWPNEETRDGFGYLEDGAEFGKALHGFGICLGQRTPMVRIPSLFAVLCPTWSLVAALLLPMGLWAGIGWRQRRRVVAGHCINCGYDLRATPEKCPECGRATNIKLKSA